MLMAPLSFIISLLTDHRSMPFAAVQLLMLLGTTAAFLPFQYCGRRNNRPPAGPLLSSPTSLVDASRRDLLLPLLLLATTTTIAPPKAVAAETIGKADDCQDSYCLGVWDGLLADCPHGKSAGAGCVCSQDDTPGIFSEP